MNIYEARNEARNSKDNGNNLHGLALGFMFDEAIDALDALTAEAEAKKAEAEAKKAEAKKKAEAERRALLAIYSRRIYFRGYR